MRRGGETIELTATEFRLLRYLMLNPRRVMTRAQLLDHVWDYDFGGDGRVLETYISYLRKKLDAHGPSLIRTVRGVGYGAAGAPRADVIAARPRAGERAGARGGRADRRRGGHLRRAALVPATRASTSRRAAAIAATCRGCSTARASACPMAAARRPAPADGGPATGRRRPRAAGRSTRRPAPTASAATPRAPCSGSESFNYGAATVAATPAAPGAASPLGHALHRRLRRLLGACTTASTRSGTPRTPASRSSPSRSATSTRRCTGCCSSRRS